MLAVALTGCISQKLYTGPQRPDQTAQLVTNPSYRMRVESIDGVEVAAFTDRYELAAGEHTLGIRSLRFAGALSSVIPGEAGLHTVAIELQPGHLYRLRGVEREEGPVPVLEDGGPARAPGPAAVPPVKMQLACFTGTAASCVELGELYELGSLELGWDEASAFKLYERACTAAHPTGCFHLAALYESGRGVAQDEARAARLFRDACDAGEARGCTFLGRHLEEGHAPPRDPLRASELYEKACNRGDLLGCYRLGSLAREGPAGRGADHARAAALFEKGCAGGELQSCLGLGHLYEDGIGVEQDELRAAALYDKACRGGVGLACASLGVMYQLGTGVPKDDGLARWMFIQGCMKGVDSACATAQWPARFRARVISRPPAPVAEPPATASTVGCTEYTPVGSHIPIRDCGGDYSQAEAVESLPGSLPWPVGEAPPPPQAPQARAPASPWQGPGIEIDGVQVSARGEWDVLNAGLLPSLATELTLKPFPAFSAVATVMIRRPPGLRLEARSYALQLPPLRLYLALGGSAFLPAVAPRASLGADVRFLHAHVFMDVAFEHFFFGEAEPNAALISLGAGWRF